MSAEPDTQDELDRLVEEFVARERRGEQPSITEYARRHPEYADDIREIFPLLSAMEEIKVETESERRAAGTKIGPYEIVREIGRGGMGIVYEAVQTDLGRRVALKILPTLATLDPRFLERFRLEAQAAARLKHPHIVPVIGSGSHDGQHYYSMQFVEGRGIDEVIREAAERLGEKAGTDRTSASEVRAYFKDATRIALQATEGIAHAHAQGVLHRDVKPSNLLLDENGDVWITDFGLCHQEGADSLTASGDVLGTFRYMPPERFSGQSDVRGDIYGIGVTLYEFLTRRKAYEDESRAALAARIVRESPRRPRALDPRIPADLETIVRKAMAHEPEQRYATAEALAADLRAYLAGRPIAARAPTLGYLLRRAIQRHRPLAITILLAVLLLAVSSVLYVIDLKEKESLARMRQYVAVLAAAEAAIRAGEGHHAFALLDEAPEEFRNWEWRHLRSRVDTSIRSFESRSVPIRSVAYAPGGAHFAVALGEEVWIYDDVSGAVEQRLEMATDPLSVCWSPNGTRLAVGRRDGLELWSWPAGERVYASEGGGSHDAVAFTRDGTEVICGVVEGEVVIYDTDGAGVLERHEMPQRVFALDHDPQTGRVLIGTGDGRIEMYELSPWKLLWGHTLTTVVVDHVGFLPGGRVGCGSRDGTIFLWDAEDGRLVRALPLATGRFAFLDDPLDRRALVIGGDALHLLDPRTGSRLRTIVGSIRVGVGAVHPGGRRAIVAASAGIREWYLGEGGEPLILRGHMDDVGSACFDPGGHVIASGGFGGEVRLWEADTGELKRVLFGHHGGISRVRFSLDGRWLASTDELGVICLWDATSAQLVRRWKAHADQIAGVAFHPESRHLYTLEVGGGLAAWDVPSGEPRAARDILPSGTALALSHDGRHLAVGGGEGRVEVRDADDLSLLHAIQAHSGEVADLAFSPDDARLASISADQTLRLWNPVGLEEVRAFTTPESGLSRDAGEPASVTFSPDGTRLVTSAFSGPIRIWDVNAGRFLATLPDRRFWVPEVHFSPDGSRLLTPNSNSTLRLYGTVPVRERVEAWERAARLRARARPVFAEIWRMHPEPEAALSALAERSDLDADLREAAIRLAHQRAGSWEELVRRMWRDLTPPDGDPQLQGIALGLGLGMWRAVWHRGNRIDPRCDSLLVLACVRTGDPTRALRVLERIGRRHEASTPVLHAVDLAVATMALAELEEPEEARARLAALESLLRASPKLATERVKGFVAEARAAVAELK